jgi:hypothetical protein
LAEWIFKDGVKLEGVAPEDEKDSRKHYYAARRFFIKEGVLQKNGAGSVVWTEDMRQKMPKLYSWLFGRELKRYQGPDV